MPLYIYSVRDARIDGRINYIGLIPKLFDTLYGGYQKFSDVFDKNELKQKSKMEIFFNRLSKQDNLLWKSYGNYYEDYLSLNDKYKILYLNLLQFKKENPNQREFLRLMKHLYEGHSTMQYGIYFGCRVAENPNDFLTMIKKEIKDYKNQKIIYYLEINKLFSIIDYHQNNYNFDSPLLYFNIRWQYGRKDDLSFTYNGINRTEMIEYISRINNEQLKVSEIICHIPLSIDMFNHVFEQYGGKRNLLNQNLSKKNYRRRRTK